MIEESIEEHINNFDKNDPKVRFYKLLVIYFVHAF